MKLFRSARLVVFFLICSMFAVISCTRKETAEKSAPEKASVKVAWDKVLAVSKTTPTLQVVVMPPLRRGAKIHDRVFQALHDLGADYVRYVPWLPYPKLAVAELEPRKDGQTSWDFSLIDPMMEDFMEAQAGHSVIVNFSTIPQWMFKTEKPVPYPADPDQVTWTYEQGKDLRDPSRKELAQYYARLVSWYTQGGFTDEAGKRHESGHHYKIDYWEVFNEVDDEHSMTAQDYTANYDAIVTAIRQVAPGMKFVALALDSAEDHMQLMEYFLDPRHHKPGIPRDMISYHFYANPAQHEPPEVQQYTFFNQADQFLAVVRWVESIRKRLSPQTQTDLDELGSQTGTDGTGMPAGYVAPPIPNFYWNLSGAMYAYIFGEAAKLGIEVAGESQMVGYPGQWSSVSMVDWNTGQPNARFWVLKLLRTNFGPGDKLVETSVGTPSVYGVGFATSDGKRKLLLVNKRDWTVVASVPGASGGRLEVVDQQTAFQPPALTQLGSDEVTLGGLAVAVVSLP
ncbi:MAG TPA: glycosyl hydrolase family 39 [Terriglobia bacterium]|nr:glycosyl hydrolase family 39 [Terriglobia bacterium]